jgi:hypothetical protein
VAVRVRGVVCFFQFSGLPKPGSIWLFFTAVKPGATIGQGIFAVR